MKRTWSKNSHDTPLVSRHEELIDGVKYFKETLSPHFIKGAQSVFLWRFDQFMKAKRGDIEMVKWIGKFSLFLKRLRDAWMEMLPMTATGEKRRRNQYLADVTLEYEERQRRSADVLSPNAQETREMPRK